MSILQIKIGQLFFVLIVGADSGNKTLVLRTVISLNGDGQGNSTISMCTQLRAQPNGRGIPEKIWRGKI